VSGDVVATGNSVIRLTDSSVAGRLIEEGEGHVIIQNLLGLGRFFELGQHGQLTSRTADVIAGAGSVKGSYGGTQSYNAFLWTRPDRVPLTPGDRYAVTFSYRILSLPSLGFEVLFLSPTAAQEGNFLPSTIISGTAGSTGTATLTNELGPYSDYKALWNIIGTGAIAVDDIQVRNLDTGQLVASENAECVSTCPFTDDPLQSNVTPIRAEHITELRRRIDFLSQRYGLALPPWIDLGLSGMWVRAAHIIQLRTAITFIYVAAGRTAPTFTDSEIVAGATSIRAVHIAELRAALATIE
jgi:hypothetical protein